MWVGLVQSVESLNRTKAGLSREGRNSTNRQVAIGFELQFFPGSPCWRVFVEMACTFVVKNEQNA